MRHVVEQLEGLGYDVSFDCDPVTQSVTYIVRCEGEIVDMGVADEVSLSRELKEICDECIKCKDEAKGTK